ncbi:MULTISPECIES: hypothetical protein [Kocuria]|uniref:SCP2 domain-containing protein n=1 Tax=Kocuria subflava TaxID=1736139 RepID=A0A846TYJ1_9MICC|nr:MULTISPECIES: hypothetical protein [Kocuria]NKE10802.1 hypothetical protein [Kocuria subflava]
MPFYKNSQQAADVFGGLFTILSEDPQAMAVMKSSGLKVAIKHKDPEYLIGFDADGLHTDLTGFTPNVRIAMSCDTAHKLWLGELLMPVALATGRVRVRGSVPKILEFIPVMRPAFDRYPSLAAAHGVS